jgi:hypothetical protein
LSLCAIDVDQRASCATRPSSNCSTKAGSGGFPMFAFGETMYRAALPNSRSSLSDILLSRARSPSTFKVASWMDCTALTGSDPRQILRPLRTNLNCRRFNTLAPPFRTWCPLGALGCPEFFSENSTGAINCPCTCATFSTTYGPLNPQKTARDQPTDH